VGLLINASLGGDKFAPASQAWVFTVASLGGLFGTASQSWMNLVVSASTPGTTLEPAYRGRYRVFSFMRANPSGAAFQTILDVGNSFVSPAMASGNQIATVMGAYPGLNSASPVYATLDMGEITLPAGASGISQADQLRLWVNVVWPNVASPAVGTTQIWFGGLWLLPIGNSGVLPHGLAIPSIGGAYAGGVLYTTPTQGGVELNGNNNESVALVPRFPPSAPLPVPFALDGRALYRGETIRLGASTTSLVMLTADRVQGATQPAGNLNVEYAQVSVSYRPQFSFLYGG
jgi:hypothetical protein